MSRWLSSVNNILESLDDQAEEHVEGAAGTVRAGWTQLLRGGTGSSSDYDDDEEEEEEEGEGSYYTEDEDDEEVEAGEPQHDQPEEDDSYYDAEQDSGNDDQLHRQGASVPTDPSPYRPEPTAVASHAVVTDAVSNASPRGGQAILAKELGSPGDDDASEESNLLDLSNDAVPEDTAGPPVATESQSGETIIMRPVSKTTASVENADKPSPHIPPPNVHPGRTKQAPPDVTPGTNQSAPTTTNPPIASTTILPKAPSSTRSASRIVPTPPPAPSSGSGGTPTVALKRTQAEVARLQKQLAQTTARADAAEAELRAQQSELEAAAKKLKVDAVRRAKEEEEAWEDAQWELEQQAAQHKQALRAQKEDYEAKLSQLRSQLQLVETQRKQEGVDLSQELQEAIHREQDALKHVGELEHLVETLQQEQKNQQEQQQELEHQLSSLQSTVDGTTKSEQKLESDMDALKTMHQRQLAQRQEREAQLEQNIAQLSAALAAERQKVAIALAAQTSSIGNANNDNEYRLKFQEASEELVTCKGQLDWSNQRCDALQAELQTLSQERLDDVEQARKRQERFDQEVSRLEGEISRLQSLVGNSARDTASSSTPMASKVAGDDDSLRNSKNQINDLSDQLVRQQNLVDASKSEALALKGRLQAALQRAEAAEREAQRAQGHSEDVENGTGLNHRMANPSWSSVGSTVRRRKRGGRTMRSALGIRATASPLVMQVVHTIDSLDLWILETGLILKQEPLARLGLVLYGLLIHLWCFALVCFHTIEAEHGDLDALTARRTVVSPHALNNP